VKAIARQIDVYIQFNDGNELEAWEKTARPHFLGQQTPNSYLYVLEGKIICGYIKKEEEKEEEKPKVAAYA